MQFQSPLQGLQAALQTVVQESQSDTLEGLKRKNSSLAEELICKLSTALIPRVTDQMYKIRNLDTGEEMDLRDESKEDFVQKLTNLLESFKYSEALETF
jgi:hypothetical protein